MNANPSFKLKLPPSLESERVRYRGDIDKALDVVVAWFSRNGFGQKKTELIDTVEVFACGREARRQVARHFGSCEDGIPAGFSGAIQGKTLLLVSRETYFKTYGRLYPDLPRSEEIYSRLAAHELAHRAHALLARSIFGSEDGMGPRWFFEGLAIACASQFSQRSVAPLSREELCELIDRDSREVLSYPVYGRCFLSLATSFPVDFLVKNVGRRGFVRFLQSEYLASEFVLEPSAGRRDRGNVLLVHGSAPFNMNGRIPVPAMDSPYAREDFYRYLSEGLGAAGWGVLRYSKPGVRQDRIVAAEYAKTDTRLLGRQLRNLWRFLPRDRPRVVFAWSEGSLHLRFLPVNEIDGVVLLGSIATNIGDVIRSQGGPSAADLRRELAGKDRCEMLGLDRPVGRLMDELDLCDNWRVFEGAYRLPILIIHGTADREVPVAQASIWRDRLARHSIRIVEGRNRDHRYMRQGKYDTAPLVREIVVWLDSLF